VALALGEPLAPCDLGWQATFFLSAPAAMFPEGRPRPRGRPDSDVPAVTGIDLWDPIGARHDRRGRGLVAMLLAACALVAAAGRAAADLAGFSLTASSR
jgi:hypothetical protein